jgi:hypothetical protein
LTPGYAVDNNKIVLFGAFCDSIDINPSINQTFMIHGNPFGTTSNTNACGAYCVLDSNLNFVNGGAACLANETLNGISTAINFFDDQKDFYSLPFFMKNNHTLVVRTDTNFNIQNIKNYSSGIRYQNKKGELITFGTNDMFTTDIDIDCFTTDSVIIPAFVSYPGDVTFLAIYDSTSYNNLPPIGTTDPTPTPHSNVKVYPNPVRGSINVQFGDGWAGSATIAIYDAMGKKITQQTTQATTTTINISGLAAGIYTIKTQGNNTNTTHKLVVY